MPRARKKYRVGETIEVAAGEVTIEKVGSHQQGNEAPAPTVTLSYETDEEGEDNLPEDKDKPIDEPTEEPDDEDDDDDDDD